MRGLHVPALDRREVFAVLIRQAIRKRHRLVALKNLRLRVHHAPRNRILPQAEVNQRSLDRIAEARRVLKKMLDLDPISLHLVDDALQEVQNVVRKLAEQ